MVLNDQTTSTANAFTTQPAFKGKSKKPGQLTDEQIKQFFDKGWVMVPDLIEVTYSFNLTSAFILPNQLSCEYLSKYFL